MGDTFRCAAVDGADKPPSSPGVTTQRLAALAARESLTTEGLREASGKCRYCLAFPARATGINSVSLTQ